MRNNTLSDRLPLPLFGAGLAAIYLGERALAGTERLAMGGVGGLLLLVALGAGVLRWWSHGQERQRAYGWVLGAYAVALLGVAGYALQTQELEIVTGKLRTVLLVGWPALLVLGLLPVIAMELAIGSMERTPTLELWRVRLASRAAWILGLAIIAFAGLNYTANAWNRKIDLSYFKTTRVGTSTQALVNNLTTPVVFTLFFPPGNEVLEQTRTYVDELARGSKHISVEVTDQALDPNKAKALKVRSNGYLVISSGERNESIRIDPDADEARDTLRGLDGEVQKRLLRVLRPGLVAYFTTGHGERDYAPVAEDNRAGLGDLKLGLEAQGFAVRRLGLGEGLGTEIPKDATIVLVIGPQEPFTPPEREAMHRYLERGGRALFAMDPDHGAPDDALLAPLGVKVSKNLIANDRYLIRVQGHGESAYMLATNRSGTHPVVETLERTAQRYWVAMFGAGTISMLQPPVPDVNVNFALHAMPQSWEDKNGNGKFDAGSETRGNYEFVAAIEKSLKPPSKPKVTDPNHPVLASDPNHPGIVADANGKTADANSKMADANGKTPDADGKPEATVDAKEPPPMRAVVVADADFIANGVLGNQGNAFLAGDTLRWLAGNEQAAGVVESEKDIPLVHRKEEDAVWFYGTSFVIPVAVLIGGLTYTRRSNRSRRAR